MLFLAAILKKGFHLENDYRLVYRNIISEILDHKTLYYIVYTGFYLDLHVNNAVLVGLAAIF